MDLPRIIYSTDTLSIVHQPGPSRYLLVTFGPAQFRPRKSASFWEDRFVRHAGIAALGIVHKVANRWYPDADMEAALPHIRPLLAQYAEVVTYGTSMGGYGALRHARRVGAATTLAFSPQWSINPGLFPFEFPMAVHFDPALHDGMEIDERHVCDNSYIFYDPSSPVDHFQVTQIANRCPAAQCITALRTGHQTIDLFASPPAAQEMIRLGRSRDVNGLIRLSSQRRRLSGVRAYHIALQAVPRRPHLAEAILASPRTTMLGLQRRLANEALGDEWLLRGDHHRAHQAFHRAASDPQGLSKPKHLAVIDRCTGKMAQAMAMMAA